METHELYQLYLKYPHITTDSRSDVKDSVFFALKGENFNGNKFASAALEKGAAFAVVDQKEYKTSDSCILVDDALLALQQLAVHHRSKLRIPIIAITGSNGKTTTKELINRVLEKKFKTMSTQGNFNNHIGVPLSLLRIRKDTEMAVIEMGANHQGEIHELCQIARPRFGLITNIGKAHLEGFGGLEGVVKAKSELYKYILQSHGSLFVNNNNPMLDELSRSIPRVTYGAMMDADCHGRISKAENYLRIIWDSVKGKMNIKTQLYGAYNFENVMAAICIGNYFGVDTAGIIDAIESYRPANRRSEILQTGRNKIIMDAYNANPSSMALAIGEFLLRKEKNKCLILGDMLELGDYALEEHENVLQIIEESQNLEVFLVGPVFSKAGQNKDYKSFKCAEDLGAFLGKHPPRDLTILIKGSRGLQLEKVLPQL
ncbi:MAG: UDP-N-acetylmuramoyl-tripeptide--D-alanyl-D-alanine ligase [Bacteroidota bacterium]|nr:UDP-N-acetylmuramoyl-tripeptide--D-alanyl-D-alanine ligase [Bacteroidota bacterium]